MKHSDSIKEIAAALSKAQGAMAGAKKDSDNPFFKSKYADLSSVVAAIKEAFAANGLSYVQSLLTNDKQECGVETMLLHSSGEWLCGDPFYVPVSKQDAQGFGSAATYCRRYDLAAMTGVAAEDDDGNAAATAKPARPNTATQVAVDAFDALSDETKDFIMSHAQALMRMHADSGDMSAYIAAQEFDTEAKLALWAKLPSNVRSAIKKQQEAARKPTPAEYASQG